MKKYTVEEVSKIFNKDKETIRRWIRDGKLTAIKTSNKKGYLIDEASVIKLIHDKDKDILNEVEGVDSTEQRKRILSDTLEKLRNERNEIDKAIKILESLLKEDES